MTFLRRLFRTTRGSKPGDAADISRGPKAIQSAPGAERETFIRETAALVGCKPEELDLVRDLQQGYGCDELDALECIQIAEDIWNVSILPNPLPPDIAEQLGRYRTLASILQAATRSIA
jgi:hypothetical protein